MQIDSNGTIWQVRQSIYVGVKTEKLLFKVNGGNGIEAFYYMSINEYGVPMYAYNATSYRKWANPPTLRDAERSFYDPSTDTMYLSGASLAHSYVHFLHLS